MSTQKIDPILEVSDQINAYELCLLKAYGAVIGGHDLHHVLGYPSACAFRQAACRGSVPVPTFKRFGFRMRFARTHDIAKWLVAVGRELEGAENLEEKEAE